MSTTPAEKHPLLPSAPEPSLSELQQNIRDAQRAYVAAWSRTTSGTWHRRAMYVVSALLAALMVSMFSLVMSDALVAGDDEGGKVALTAHIMSKCPDARDCLRDLVVPAMMEVGKRVEFRLEYIGNVTKDGGVACKHGDDECLGNIIELCAQKEYPDPRIHLGFTMCLTRDYQLIPERTLVDNCALEHGIDVEKLNKCSTDGDGYLSVEGLQASFNRSKSAGVTKSCTVRLNNQIRCVRDGGEWKDCPGGHDKKDLVRDVMDLTDDF